MALVPVKTPKIIKKMFPNYVWDITTKRDVIYLTFDDGPTPEITKWVLNTLNAYNAKATFFCIGNNIEKHPDIFQNIIKEGHAIGNHTHNHIKGWKTSSENYLNNVLKAQAVINPHITDSNVKFFRPPYGKISKKQGRKLRDLNYNIIMWDILSFDWDKNTSGEKCLNNVIRKTSNGSIIVFHDSVKAAKNLKYVLPKVLTYFTEKGYTFESINESEVK